ncbi:TetR family transcriptional regulator [Nocardioides baekrokdamisoli]|uniref:TetR family transcriptional regulator n=1 Tax=Nocardioides baekrokdamisoli TaxID=1804624 RepID=A0A3G9IDI5_9ACTN|nr:TetR/AcrR family transcriptional regulator [Nocardioides baekrokdamisoli]BBH16432.1 TetR family transcriptional regulator [Nocardioides baekrokdamisoli]
MRERLVTAAVAVIAEHGVGGFSARRVTRAANTSTMAVYTQFGSMESLVEAVIDVAFSRMERALAEAPATDDPLRDVSAQTLAYLNFATHNRDLYGVMFGTIPLGPYRRTTPSQLRTGRTQTLDRVGANLARAADEGRIAPRPITDLAFMWWSTIHGYALLETTGHIRATPGRNRILAALLETMFIGLGDRPAEANDSVTRGLNSGHGRA